MTGKIVLVGTPIGNLEDITLRALRVLATADVIACEDTRRTRKLFSHHGIHPGELVSYHEHNERRRASELVSRARRGEAVAVVSDAGMPAVSDPGYEIVTRAIDEGVDVEIVPGPTAAISALAVSGLPSARFVFEGFLPRKTSDRRRRLRELAGETRTMVVFESPHRVHESLQDILDLFGDRPAALVRELTKLHEEVRRERVSALLEGVRSRPPKGEIALVIGGAMREERTHVPREELAHRAARLMEQGMPRKDAMAQVAREARVARREVFDALVERRDS